LYNPALTQLGLAKTDRAIIFHADDIGMCQASVSAYAELLEFGLLSSASTMTPCPWFPAAARIFRQQQQNPKLDIGVHITLTSEWDQMRWGPLSTRDSQSGLLDDEGYFYRKTDDIQARANPATVAQEMATQIELALDAQIDITHIDSHMGAVFCPQFFPDYVRLGFEHNVPAFIFRRSEEQFIASGYSAEIAANGVQLIAEIEANGMPILDQFQMMPLSDIGDRQAHAQSIIDALPPGSITYFIIHPTQKTPELRALAPDWAARVGD